MNKPILMFDLGGVIENHNFFDMSKFISKVYCVDSKEFHNKMIDLLRLNDENKITDLQFISKLNDYFGLNFTLESFYKIYFRFIKTDNNMLSFIKKLSKNYKIALFSNTRKIHLKESERRWKVKSVFGYVFISQNYSMRKPELRYYKLVLEKMKVKGSDVIFIDDKERNFPPADKLGIKCIKYTNLTNLKKELKKLNIF
ncbi:MAG TPA: HAD-IA family hydrolase [Candidatus Nanoarchaeia archaeon]|nr:HAD-IA family hydrolase [Candidatus Nanoarchaeia archaeon]